MLAVPLTVTRQVALGALGLPGELVLVPQARGIVVVAHGSGSGRLSPRNRFVAEVLHGYRLATLLFDLLADSEAGQRALAFDIPLLARRLTEALQWQRSQADIGHLQLGLFGASTGAAAALQAAAAHPSWVSAIVCRGGRPDLAAAALDQVRAPTLLLVGACDTEVLRLNRAALRAMRCETRLEVVPGATHLFAEPGALVTVAHLAGHWFSGRLGPPAQR
jgi:putative phosphoribosyl transferase